MRDLIERVDRKLRLTQIGYPPYSEMVLSVNDLKEILTALRTLQRIEGLMSDGYAPEFYIDDNGEYVCSLTKNYYGATLPLAVEAAVEGGK